MDGDFISHSLSLPLTLSLYKQIHLVRFDTTHRPED